MEHITYIIEPGSWDHIVFHSNTKVPAWTWVSLPGKTDKMRKSGHGHAKNTSNVWPKLHIDSSSLLQKLTWVWWRTWQAAEVATLGELLAGHVSSPVTVLLHGAQSRRTRWLIRNVIIIVVGVSTLIAFLAVASQMFVLEMGSTTHYILQTHGFPQQPPLKHFLHHCSITCFSLFPQELDLPWAGGVQLT